MCLAKLLHQRSKVLLVLQGQRHLVASALKMRLQDDLTLKIDDEIIHMLVEQFVGVIDVVLVNWK